MFYLWAIPLALAILVIIWMIFSRLQHRIRSGERTEGEVVKDE